MGGEVIKKEEKQLVLECRTLKEFALKYIEKFGMPSRASRINGMWTDRKKYRDELSPKVIEIPGGGTIIQQRTDKDRAASLPDIGEEQVKTNNLLAVLIKLQEESNRMQFDRLALMRLAMPKKEIVIHNAIAGKTDEKGQGKEVRQSDVPLVP